MHAISLDNLTTSDHVLASLLVEHLGQRLANARRSPDDDSLGFADGTDSLQVG